MYESRNNLMGQIARKLSKITRPMSKELGNHTERAYYPERLLAKDKTNELHYR